MTNVTRKTTNRFTKGLVMDFSPENTKNEVLTNALNATLLTFNGNELSLQNDMGNARVETAYLPSGYIPVGTCEYGGIIYIVSYNPLENKSLIGCFPSPERVITREELGEPVNIELESSIFQDVKTGEIKHNTLYVLLKNSNLNPGDKFIITAKEDFTEENLADLWEKQNDTYTLKNHPILALNVVSIEDSGKIVYLNSTTRLYEFDNHKYHILKKYSDSNEPIDLDEYRNVLSSGYSVFRSKTSGKLAILAELIMIDSYSVTHYLKPGMERGEFDIMLSTEIFPEVTKENYNTVPKLKFHYLQNSQGYLQTSNYTAFLFNDSNLIKNVKLSDIYTTDNNETLGKLSTFNFPKSDTYHSKFNSYEGDINENVYTKFLNNEYHRVTYSLVIGSDRKVKEYFNNSPVDIYKYLGGNGDYILFEGETLDEQYSYFVKDVSYTYHDVNRNTQYKNSNLYKINTNHSIANAEVKKDTSIEKFKYLRVVGYEPVSIEDLENLDSSVKIYYKTEEGKYASLETSPDPTKLYYKEVVELSLISIGFIDATENIGTIYYFPSEKTYAPASTTDKNKYWDTDTYPDTPPLVLYYIREHESWRIATEEEKSNPKQYKLYYRPDYIKLNKGITIHGDYTELLFVLFHQDTYVNYEIFLPDEIHNWIKGKEKPDGEFPKDTPIELYEVSDYLLELGETYHDIKLASIKLPSYVVDNDLDLPFEYSYTIVPCMNYGKLDHLKVSNTINFSNLHAFDKSKFNVWKYYISDELLRLTFGAEVFDTYEDYKVDGLILEFYDCWGFAGSLEITNKKSYSGVFTKTIPLNTINAISNKQISDGAYVESKYVRNINILPKGETSYEYNGKKCTKDAITGFKPEEGIVENDCGTLFSNIVYGVKTYFRKTTDRGLEFIEKDKFFLYTLPIFNDYYHNTENFATLENPGIDFILTYKLTDESKKQVYQEKDTYVNGYNKTDKNTVDKYLSSKLETKEDLIGLTKYYLYTGTSNVLLEVGIHKDYENLNMRCDPAINEHFSCTLELISDDNSSVSVLSSKENTVENILSNLLNFGNTKSTLKINNIRNHNFINLTTSYEPIPITYNFVVGYNIDIINIRNTQIPATTICALCHEKDDGTWNYEDFGVYTKEDANGETLYLSNAMFYNEGDFETEVFGVCRQVSLEGKIVSQLLSIRSIESEASKITVPGKLNSGEPLKLLSSHIGKLTFCQPHAHGLSEVNGVNVHCKTPDTDLYYAIPPNVIVYGGDYEDDTRGLVPTPLMFNKPIYNLSLNTYDSIKYNSEFISTLDYNILEKKMILGSNLDSAHNVLNWASTPEAREFTGLTGLLVLEFNKKMVETMKYVYAYNPDYDLLNVDVGEAVLQNHYPIFTSNLISKNAVIDGDINDYIYLGPISFTKYLKELVDNSGIEINESVKLKPKLTYCGGDSPYLITSLTYNALVPKELKEELEFNSSDIVMVRHANLTSGHDQLKGNPDKKVLYGFKNNKLIQLDVSNYSIDTRTGVLNIKDDMVYAEDFVYVQKTKKYSDIKLHLYVIPKLYLNACLCETSITLNDLIYEPNLEGHRLFMRNNLCSFDSYLRGKLFYRYLNVDMNGNLQRHTSWAGDVVGNLDMNALYLYTGPCFKKRNNNE